MGMDYRWSGSSSYPRFDRELCAIAAIFGGIKTDHLKERESTEGDRPLGYWFGFLSSDDQESVKFVFPSGTDEVLVKWFNNPYGNFTAEETKIIWNNVSKHPEIQDISDQIWGELETLVEFGEEWDIY